MYSLLDLSCGKETKRRLKAREDELREEEERERHNRRPAFAPVYSSCRAADEGVVVVERNAMPANHATTKNGSDTERDGGTDGDGDSGSTGGDDDAAYGEVWSVPELRRREG